MKNKLIVIDENNTIMTLLLPEYEDPYLPGWIKGIEWEETGITDCILESFCNSATTKRLVFSNTKIVVTIINFTDNDIISLNKLSISI